MNNPFKRDKNELADTAQSQDNLRHVRIRLTITYVALIIAAVVAVSTLTINSAEKMLTEKTMSLLASLNMQMKLGVRNYMEEIEEMAVFLFSDKEISGYDPSQSADETQRVQKIAQITEKLQKASLMKNLCDFSIVYRDGESAGELTDGTRRKFGDTIFDELCKMTAESRGLDKWLAGYQDDFDHIYYIKQLNENALLVLSFYSMELSHVFEHSADTDQMTISLVNDEQRIIYSSEEEEIGKTLPADMEVSMGDDTSASVANATSMYNIAGFGGGWQIFSLIEASAIADEYQNVRMDAALVAIFIVILGVIASLVVSRSVTNPLTDIVGGLSEKAECDQLTGNLNKMTFERYAEEWLDDETITDELAYFLTDVDDFKLVNDVCGHAAGDRVLRQYGRIITDLFYRDLTGRIGGDEFAMLVRIPDTETPRVYVAEKIKVLQQRVSEIHEENADIHVSIGIAFRGGVKRSLSDMYRNADKALYATKRRGKNGYTIYNETLAGEDEA